MTIIKPGTQKIGVEDEFFGTFVENPNTQHQHSALSFVSGLDKGDQPAKQQATLLYITVDCWALLISGISRKALQGEKNPKETVDCFGFSSLD
jgi:hypothetical protein